MTGADSAVEAPSILEDFVGFCDHYHDPLFDWQREVATLAFRRERGRFKYRLVGISTPRGDGKSALGAKLGKWALLRHRGAHVLSAALSVDGSRVVFNYGREAFRGVGQSVRALKDRIEIASGGSR